MDIKSLLGKPLSEIQNILKDKNVTIIDTNSNSVFDAADKCQYKVQEGDTLWEIALKLNGKDLNGLRESNPRLKKSDIIQPGEIINIPLILQQAKDKAKTVTPQPQPQQEKSVVEKPKTTESLFGNIKAKKFENSEEQKWIIGENADYLKKYGYFVDDKNKNGVFDEGEDLYKQITVMLDAGHGSGVHLEQKQKINLPNGKTYTTKADDTLALIAQANEISINELKELNPNVRYSRDPGAVPPKEIGDNDEASFTGLAVKELREFLENQGFKVIDNVRTDGEKKHRLKRRLHKLRMAPDMFISLHLNSCVNQSAAGEEICYNPASKEDKKFAQVVNEELKKDKTIEKNRGLQKRPENTKLSVGVLNGDTKGQIAEILVELGFISNKGDYDKLNNESTRKKQLEAVARGVLNYYNAAIKND